MGVTLYLARPLGWFGPPEIARFELPQTIELARLRYRVSQAGVLVGATQGETKTGCFSKRQDGERGEELYVAGESAQPDTDGDVQGRL